MGHSNYTPHYNLSQFVPSDKPGWLGDYNGDMSKIDAAIRAVASKGGDFFVSDYGAKGGVGFDNTEPINAAVDDCARQGGGRVHLLKGMTCGWDGEIILKSGVMLVGSKVTSNESIYDMIAQSSHSRIRVGNYSSNWMPNGIQNLSIDGDRNGPTALNDGIVWYEATESILDNVRIDRAAGAGIYFNAAQNSLFNSVEVGDSLRGIVFDNGSGGLHFTRTHATNCGTGISFIDTPSMGNAYPFGSAQITFETGIVEYYSNAHNPLITMLDMQAGSLVHWIDFGFSNNDVTVPTSEGALCKISNAPFPTISTNTEFTSCIWVGAASDAAIRVVGPQTVEVNGLCYVGNNSPSGTMYFYLQDGGIANQVALNFTNIIEVGSVEMTGAVHGGTTARAFLRRFTTTSHEYPDANHWPLEGKITGDAGVRWYIDGNGGLHWVDGTNYTDKASVSYDYADDAALYVAQKHIFSSGPVEMTAGQERYGSNVVHKAATQYPAGVLTLDMAIQETFVIAIVGTGHLDGLTIDHAVEGSTLKLIILSDGGGQICNFPSSMLWPTGSEPTNVTATAGACHAYSFIYDNASSKWLYTGGS